jgi:hypothetical protein
MIACETRRESHHVLSGICTAMIAISIAFAAPTRHHRANPKPYESTTQTIEWVR